MTSDRALFERANYKALSKVYDCFDARIYLHLKRLARKVHSFGKPKPKNTILVMDKSRDPFYVSM